MHDFGDKDPFNKQKPEQASTEKADEWFDAMDEMPPYEQRDAIEKQPEGIKEDNSVEAMAARATADGYTPRKVGEQSVLATNQDGKIRIESEYRNIWNDIAAEDPDFYKNLDNQAFSIAIWDICNTAMFTDLNPDNLFDEKNWSKTWEQCTKLHELMQDPKYQKRGEEFLARLDEMGNAGSDIVAIMDTVSQKLPDREESSTESELEPDETEEYYNQLNQYYDDIMSKDFIDTDDLEDLISAYTEIKDYKDASERINTLQDILDRLEATSRLFDD